MLKLSSKVKDLNEQYLAITELKGEFESELNESTNRFVITRIFSIVSGLNSIELKILKELGREQTEINLNKLNSIHNGIQLHKQDLEDILAERMK